MRSAILVGGVLVALVALPVVIGALLPRDHVATLTAHIAASPDTVWRTITDPASFPSWRADVRRVELLPPVDGKPSWREHSKTGAITMVADSADAPRHLVTRIADRNLPFGGSWDYTIVPEGTGASRVTIAEHGSVYNPLFRFVSRFVMGHTTTIDAYLRALGRKFGDEPTPTRI